MKPRGSPLGAARVPTLTPASHSRSMSEMRAPLLAAFSTIDARRPSSSTSSLMTPCHVSCLILSSVLKVKYILTRTCHR